MAKGERKTRPIFSSTPDRLSEAEIERGIGMAILGLQNGYLLSEAHSGDGGIVHEDVTIGKRQIGAILRLLETESTKGRLRRLAKSQGGGDLALTSLFHGVLKGQFRGTSIHRSHIREAAEMLVSNIPAWAVASIARPETVSAEELERRDFISLLENSAKNITRDLTTPGSVAEQLVHHPLCAAGMGIFVNTRNINDIKVVESFTSIFQRLSNDQTSEWLQEWIIGQFHQGDHRERMFQTLIAITRMTTFLDYQSAARILSQNHDELLLSPYQGLYRAVREAAEKLSAGGSTNMELVPLHTIERELFLFHEQAIRGPISGKVKLAEIKPLTSLDVKGISDTIFSWSEQCPHLSPEQQGYYIARFLQGIEAKPEIITNVLGEIGVFGEYDRRFTLLSSEATRSCRWLGILPSEEPLSPLRQTFEVLSGREIKDLWDIDFRQIVPEGTRKVVVHLGTGTWGPTHPGHQKNIASTCAEIDFIRRSKMEKDGTVHIIILLPTPNMFGVEEYTKKLSRTNLLSPRVMSLLLNLSEIFRVFPGESKNLFLTSLMQPFPDETGNIVESIRQFIDTFEAKMARDLGFSDAQLLRESIELEYHQKMGMDELQADPRRDKFRNRPMQPAKISAETSYGAMIQVDLLAFTRYLSATLRSMPNLIGMRTINRLDFTRGGKTENSSTISKQMDHPDTQADALRLLPPALATFVSAGWNHDIQTQIDIDIQQSQQRFRGWNQATDNSTARRFMRQDLAKKEARIVHRILRTAGKGIEPRRILQEIHQHGGRISVTTIAQELKLWGEGILEKATN